MRLLNENIRNIIVNTDFNCMVCAPPEKPGEEHGISSLSSDNDGSDDSSNSLARFMKVPVNPYKLAH